MTRWLQFSIQISFSAYQLIWTVRLYGNITLDDKVLK
jgi:hypothetical protein